MTECGMVPMCVCGLGGFVLGGGSVEINPLLHVSRARDVIGYVNITWLCQHLREINWCMCLSVRVNWAEFAVVRPTQ